MTVDGDGTRREKTKSPWEHEREGEGREREVCHWFKKGSFRGPSSLAVRLGEEGPRWFSVPSRTTGGQPPSLQTRSPRSGVGVKTRHTIHELVCHHTVVWCTDRYD